MKGVGLQRLISGLVNIANLKRIKSLTVFVLFLTCLNICQKLHEFWHCFSFQIHQNEQCVLKVTWDKAFSHFCAVVGKFDWIIYLEHTEVTPPFVYSQAYQRWQTNKSTILKVLKRHFFHIVFALKNTAKLNCQILMPRALSHIVTSSADHIVKDEIYTYGIDLQQCIPQKLYFNTQNTQSNHPSTLIRES